MTTTEERIDLVSSFDAGMQRRTTRFLSQPNEVFFAKNTDFQYLLGGIAKALGYEKKGNSINSGAPILGCGSLNTSTGTNKILVFSGTDAYVWDGSSNWAAQSVGFSSGEKYETANFIDLLWVAGGNGQRLRTYSGSAFDTLDFNAAPFGKYIIVDKSRLYVFNCGLVTIGTFASRFFYTDLPTDSGASISAVWGLQVGIDLVTTAASDIVTSVLADFITNGIKVGDPFFIFEGADIGQYEVKSVDSANQITLTEDLTATASNLDYWTGGNWEDVERNNSDVGMGIGKNNDRVLFFKRFSVHKWNKGDTDAENTLIPIKGIPGTTSHRSIVNVRDFTFYWSDTGLWRYDGSSSQIVSNPIQEIIDGIAVANLDDIVGWNVKDRIVKMYVGNIDNADTGLTITNCVICYDIFANAFWVEEYDDVINCSTKWVESSELKNFIFSNDGEAFQSEKGNSYNGTAFPMEIETWFRYPIAPEVQVNFTRFKTYTQHGREITCVVKFAYYTAEGGYRVDNDWRPMKPKYKTQDEQEWVVSLADLKAAGYALKFIENSSSNARPAVERIAAFYTGGEIR